MSVSRIPLASLQPTFTLEDCGDQLCSDPPDYTRTHSLPQGTTTKATGSARRHAAAKFTKPHNKEKRSGHAAGKAKKSAKPSKASAAKMQKKQESKRAKLSAKKA